ncbi:hypothetical protein [Falsiroseomonas oryziterrae]|uniref:hypothetical protein n=1 Tax=Falsiroseomonas oryziterrae TaxID=2911368 RepID=UPI001F29CA21|nr:hypothetical protein [Roseomonas sp. NPKOSM-4]
MTDATQEDPAALAARQVAVTRQLDLMLDDRSPVQLIRQLVAELDQLSADLNRILGDADDRAAR